MKKKFFMMTILGFILFFSVKTEVYSETLVADLGDVRIFSMYGYFRVESDRTRQSFPLNFKQRGGWVEIGCSSVVREYAADKVGEGVEWVVTTYLAGNVYAGYIANKVATWAAGQGLEYLCRYNN